MTRPPISGRTILPEQNTSVCTCISRHIAEKLFDNDRSSSYAPVSLGKLSSNQTLSVSIREEYVPSAPLLEERDLIVDAEGNEERDSNTNVKLVLLKD